MRYGLALQELPRVRVEGRGDGDGVVDRLRLVAQMTPPAMRGGGEDFGDDGDGNLVGGFGAEVETYGAVEFEERFGRGGEAFGLEVGEELVVALARA
jgi:hypothetical protein